MDRYNVAREKLVEVARARGTIYYGEVASHVGMAPKGIGGLLGRICEEEVASGRPMLSAVAVSRASGKPSAAFFDLAKTLRGYSGGTDAEKAAFYAEELRRVYEYWG